MKPIRLVISGLNSFKEEQTIDFRDLCQGNVFGIFGPTGSGKSTIVDAITLALYGSVKRAARRTQGIVNKALNEASVLFEFQLGSAADRKHYRVERKYVAKDDSVNCRLARLSEMQGEAPLVLADKPSLVDQAVAEILGLTEDDFTRAVVLPQGHFAEFLNLQGSERRRMLERIFGLEEYGEKLNKVISERLKAAETNLQGLQRSQDLLGDATAAAVEAAQHLEQTAQAELEACKTRSETARNELEQWRRVRERQQELEQAQAALKELEQQASSVAALEAKLGRQAAAQRIAASLQAFDQGNQRVQAAVANLERLAAQVATAKAANLQAQQAVEQAQQAKQQQEEPLLQAIEQLKRAQVLEQQAEKQEQELRTKAQAGRELTQKLQTVTENLQTVHGKIVHIELELKAWQLEQEQNRILPEQREQLAAAGTMHEGLLMVQRQLETVIEEIHSRQHKLSQLQAELANLEKHLTAAIAAEAEQQQLYEQLVAQAPVAVASQQLAAASVWLQAAQQLAQDGGNLQRQQQAVVALENTIGELKRQLASSVAAVAAEAAAVQTATQAFTQLEQEVAAARAQNMAAILAEQLSAGQACPVCGSHEHPVPNSGKNNQHLEQLLARLAAARSDLDTKQTSYTAAGVAQAAQQGELERQQLDLVAANEQLQICEARVQEQLSKFPAEWTPTDNWAAVPALAQNHMQELSDQLQQRADWQARVETSKGALEVASERTRQLQQQQELLLQSRTSQQGELEQLTIRQSSLQADTTARQDALTRCLAALGEADLATARARYQERDARLTELERLLKQHQAAKDTLLKETRQLEQETNQLKEQQAEARTDYRLHQAQLLQLQQELAALTDGAKAAELLAEAQQTLATLREQATAAQANYEQARNQLVIVEQNLRAGQEASRLANDACEQAKTMLAAALEREQFVTRAEAEEALGWADLVAEWQQTIEDYKRQQEFLQGRQVELVGLLAGQSISDEAWLAIAEQVRVASEQHLQAVEALATAQADLANVRQRNRQWQDLENEREQLAKDVSLLSELVTLLRGNALVEFMAGEHLDAIAGIASDWLGVLTAQRYALEVAPDGGFLIRDDGNGGTKRPVATLSGGETFITSLALALALSSQIQLRGKHSLEFFFLDEGFGSLDPKLLETVMGCLERMQGQAMSIGIISHVPELRERVMCQVVVEPAEPGGRGSRIEVVAG